MIADNLLLLNFICFKQGELFMQKLSNAHSYSQVIRASRFLSIRLKSYDHLKEMTDKLNRTRQILQDLHEKWQQAQEEQHSMT